MQDQMVLVNQEALVVEVLLVVLPQHLFLQQQQLELEMILQQLLLKDFQVEFQELLLLHQVNLVVVVAQLKQVKQVMIQVDWMVEVEQV
tara:strand:+ start:113 stop:379 length:267 start_codon:yes stop_codon:yes gene_type:complete